MWRILIADDHFLVRAGFKAAFLKGLRDVSIGEAESAEEALALTRKEPWDLVVMDVTMPGRSGLDVLKDMAAERPHLPVLMLSAHTDSELTMRALRSGAAGFISKTSPPEELIRGVKTILEGGKYVSEDLAKQVVLELGTQTGRLPHESLSNREYEVLCLIATAKAPSEIAQKLGVSVKTVSTYRSRILTKMRMHTTAELMHYAIRHGLVE